MRGRALLVLARRPGGGSGLPDVRGVPPPDGGGASGLSGLLLTYTAEKRGAQTPEVFSSLRPSPALNVHGRARITRPSFLSSPERRHVHHAGSSTLTARLALTCILLGKSQNPSGWPSPRDENFHPPGTHTCHDTDDAVQSTGHDAAARNGLPTARARVWPGTHRDWAGAGHDDMMRSIGRTMHGRLVQLEPHRDHLIFP